MEYLRVASSRADADAGPDAAVVVKAQAVADVGGKVDVAAQAHALLAALSHEAAKVMIGVCNRPAVS
eukprot:scaffold4647_cov393-Prasinococcus_capsulatus_cf.AAC.2